MPDRLLTVICVLLALSGCRKDNAADVPRPEAWPRADVPAAVYRTAGYGRVSMSVNAAAKVDTVDNGLTISYPGLNAAIYVTVISTGASEYATTLEQRMRRIDLNLNGISADAAETENADGFRLVQVTALSATQTPVQLLAASARRDIIVTATAFLNTTATVANRDSLAPYTEVLGRDLTALGTSLKAK